MGKIGSLDTDTAALAARINAHSAYGSRSLEDWVFSHLDVQPNFRILELGCGTGKQTLPIAEAIGSGGHITAVDISEKSLSILQDSAEQRGLTDRIQSVNCGLDDTQLYASARVPFDRAIACYSIYYANDPQKVFGAVHEGLTQNGKFFFCGPAGSNNAELKEFHSKLSGREAKLGAAPFMEGDGQRLAAEIFSSVEVFQFENPLKFDSPTALYEYWRSYNLYDPALDSDFVRQAENHFAVSDSFTTFKRVLGILANK